MTKRALGMTKRALGMTKRALGMTRGLRLLDRLRLRREELRPALGDVQAVLETNSELAVDRDHRLVAEAHARLDLRRVPSHEVRPLVAIHADTVPCAVWKTRHLVVG